MGHVAPQVEFKSPGMFDEERRGGQQTNNQEPNKQELSKGPGFLNLPARVEGADV